LVPILLYIADYLVTKKLNSKLHAYFVYPAAWPRHWKVNIHDTGSVEPTRGQAIYILVAMLLNLFLSFCDMCFDRQGGWTWDQRSGRTISALANRFGALASANIPLIVLYSTRNNFLLWLTGMFLILIESCLLTWSDWSHPTFLMLHRCMGYIAVIQAVLHSILFLALGIQERVIDAWQRDRAWIAGSLATVAVALIAPLALGLVRKTMYELFLMLHITATVILLVGAYYHLFYLYGSWDGGYLYYIWIAVAFWAFDRVARIARIASNGIKTAQVTIIDKDYIRLYIPNAKAHGHAYLYFPTLNPWTFWENHVS
jgi:hypothetical protein